MAKRVREQETETQQNTPNQGRPTRATVVAAATLANMFKIATFVQQIMTEQNGTVSKEENIVSISKVVPKLMNGNGH
jgi:hypothetical protein